ncbi:hypothetical protein IJ750_00080, partial [bacterium]|nr:hypothetical protein [bacterium]
MTTSINFRTTPQHKNVANVKFTQQMQNPIMDDRLDDMFIMQQMQNQKAEKKERSKDKWYKTGIGAQVVLAAAFSVMAAVSYLTYRMQSKGLSKEAIVKFKQLAKDSLPGLESDSVNPKARNFIKTIKE